MTEIARAIKGIAGVPADMVTLIDCEVISVDEANRLCAATSISGKEDIEFAEVRLMATIDDGLFMLPTIGSTIVVAYANQCSPYVAMFSSIDHIITTTGDTIFKQAATFSMKTSNESAAKLLSDMIDAILQLVTQSPNGDGTLSPTSTNTFQNIKNRIPNLFT